MMFLEPFRTYGVFKSEYGPKGLFYRSVLKDSISSQYWNYNLYELFREEWGGKSKIRKLTIQYNNIYFRHNYTMII